MIVAIVLRKGNHSNKAIESASTTPQCQKVWSEYSINDRLDSRKYLVVLVVRTTTLNQSQETVKTKVAHHNCLKPATCWPRGIDDVSADGPKRNPHLKRLIRTKHTPWWQKLRCTATPTERPPPLRRSTRQGMSPTIQIQREIEDALRGWCNLHN